MSKSKSSGRWLQEHFDDEYVKRAKKEGYRSRAAYKLLEVQEKYKLFKPGQTVVDLGAAPGGWSQIAKGWMMPGGVMIALDILDMTPLPDVHFILGDFREDTVLAQLEARLDGRAVDIVISDMAPNMSGQKSVDIPRAMYLAELAADFADNHLRQGGAFVTKLFHGEGFEEYIKELRSKYQRVVIFKPESSRDRSPEVYAVAMTKKDDRPKHMG